MPSIPKDNWNARRSFILTTTDDLLDKHPTIKTVRAAYLFIAENIYGCDVSSIYRAVKPYQGESKKQVEFIRVVQLSFPF